MHSFNNLSRPHKIRLAALSVVLTSLIACSQQPVRSPPPPLVIPCPPPQVDNSLLIPPGHGMIDQLLVYLNLSPVQLPSAAMPSSVSPPSSLNSGPSLVTKP